MAREKIIIDTDPGQDDAVAMLLAFGAPEEIEVLGITAVAGNAPLHLTEVNARKICELARRTDVKVFAGCDRPLFLDLHTAPEVHGETGLDGPHLPMPTMPLQEQHAVDFIIETLRSHDAGTVTLCPIGPLTNIATALTRAPDIAPRIKQIVLMGGAQTEGGNSSPVAEFNIFVDPHAADIVLRCGAPIVMFPLDVTHQVLTSQRQMARVKAIPGPIGQVTYEMLDFYRRYDEAKYGTDGGPLHDPCTIAWLLKPELFSGKLCNVAVETASPLTIGQTVVDKYLKTGRPANVHYMMQADADGFFDLLIDRLLRLV
ncbi:nucleoside hydrolase [Niveispirillum sp. BGYR6]|uniref:nucleoside hydrolase n=1 Tax=Niveispirillum sp. BGYR6 TaxID=2971249 RepID=UPI0022B96CD2|nr:nucleoside hydrolase [Niveispirillum sp. BGYR6]MDG5494448.1 nucleoside hydrolase [Niveispirillum sp. BGYR6]